MTVRLRSAIITTVVLSIVATGPVLAGGTTRIHTATASDSRGTASIDTSSAIVELSGAPLATLNAGQSKRVDFKSPKVKSARALLVSIRNDFKRWLRTNAPKARVTSEYDVALNAVSVDLNGTDIASLRSAPGVVAATLQMNYEMLDAPVDPDLALIDALDAWGAGGAANAGAGVKVAVIDSGIDQTHPCFDGSGYPGYSGDQGEAQFTNSKVVVAKVFNMRAKVRNFNAFPGIGQEHGTHVAGTIACEPLTPASVDGAAVPYGVTGVAPAAQLGNYNVFPGDVTSARSEDILNALQAAFEDGMDLANMSLGGGANGVQDLLTHAVDNLDRGGMLVAISAGNNGPGLFTLGSPGSAERALTSGAYSVGHFVGLPVTWTGDSALTATGEFAVPSTPLTAPLAVVAGSPLGLACATLPTGSLAGKIALVSRGSCTFGTKIYNAEAAGAVGVIVVNNSAGAPTAMAGDGHVTSIPAVMASLSDRADLIAANGLSVTIGSIASYAHDAANDLLMQSFSSQGPSDVDFRVKPDVVAPGGNVLSSIPGNDWAFYSGTSMSSPHLAGMAAVVLGQHPTWTAAEIRSAIVNTANPAVVKNSTNPLVIGNGAADLFKAVAAKVALDPVSTSFGAIPVLNGHTSTRTIAFKWLDGSGAPTVTVIGSDAFGASYANGVITVTYTPRETGYGPQHAVLKVSDGTSIVATSRLFAWGK
jgi:subtilisin family serine protease